MNETNTAAQRAYAYVMRLLGENETIRNLIRLVVIGGGWAVDPQRLELWIAVALLVSGFLGAVLPAHLTELKSKRD
jgi:hypothetical protein